MFDDLIGVRFAQMGRDKTTGLDCWGLAMEVYRRFGITLPDFIVDSFACQTIENTAWEEVSQRRWEEVFTPENKDVPLLVLVKNHPLYANHVGVYLGDDRMIHTNAESGVVIAHIEGHLKQRIVGYYRRVQAGA